MDKIKQKTQEFNKRWKVINGEAYAEEFRKFKIRILNIFNEIDNHITSDGVLSFCQVLGIPSQINRDMYGEPILGTDIIDQLTQELDEKQFYFMLELIFALPFKPQDYEHQGNFRIELFKKFLNAVNLSNINLAVTVNANEVILYPKGEEALDAKLVEEVLSFLNKSSQKHFIDALKFYEKRNSENAIKSSESIRRSLEEFLRFKFSNSKGLKENLNSLAAKLKEGACNHVIRNIIFKIFTYLDTYFNENSKHNDGPIDPVENEFLLYQAGLLMRYLHQALRSNRIGSDGEG